RSWLLPFRARHTLVALRHRRAPRIGHSTGRYRAWHPRHRVDITGQVGGPAAAYARHGGNHAGTPGRQDRKELAQLSLLPGWHAGWLLPLVHTAFRLWTRSNEHIGRPGGGALLHRPAASANPELEGRIRRERFQALLHRAQE